MVREIRDMPRCGHLERGRDGIGCYFICSLGVRMGEVKKWLKVDWISMTGEAAIADVDPRSNFRTMQSDQPYQPSKNSMFKFDFEVVRTAESTLRH